MDRLDYQETRLAALEVQVFGAPEGGSEGGSDLLSAHAMLEEGLQQLHSNLASVEERAPVYPECCSLTTELRERLHERERVVSGLQERVDELIAERGELERFVDVLVLLESSSAQSCFDLPPGASKQQLASMDSALATLAEEVAAQQERSDSFLDRYEALVALASDVCIERLAAQR